ncbi:hypothetical protein VB714_12255 [Spirulina sp. 06S082]|nr:hypothetical protein [Spirulina sp. 06S082]
MKIIAYLIALKNSDQLFPIGEIYGKLLGKNIGDKTLNPFVR